MILKSISTSSVGNLLRYVLRDKKPKGRVLESQADKAFAKYKAHKDPYVCGIKLSERDIQNLDSERVDAKLLFDLKNFKGSMNQFIENLIKAGTNPKQPKEEVAVIHTHNLRSRETAGFEKEFMDNEAKRIHKSSRQIAATHFILSWNNKETSITDKMLQSMAKEFVRLRGDNNLYVFTKHAEPGKHVHLHVAMSATKLNGLSSRITKAEYASLKLSMDSFQRKNYDLSHSLPQHGRSKSDKALGKETVKNKKIADRAYVKKELLKHVESVTLSAMSSKQFFSHLENQGFKAYSRNGKMTGLQHENGLKFRFSRLGIDVEKMLQRDATILKEEKSLMNLRDGLNRPKARIDRIESLSLSLKSAEVIENAKDQENKATELSELRDLQENASNIERGVDDDHNCMEEAQSEDNGQDNLKDNTDECLSSSEDNTIYNS